jgi:hypothetical protein
MLIAPVACVGKKTTTPTTTTDTKLQSDVATLQTKVASLIDTVSNLETPPNYKPNIDALEQQVADLEASNADFEARITELEAGSSFIDTDGGGEFVTTRWSPSIQLEKVTDDLDIDEASISWYPTRIKDEDTYRISFGIVNEGAEVKNEVLYIVFTPSSKDTYIDVANTGMYSTKPVNIWWDVDYNPTSGENCKRIEFISDQFTVPAGDTMEISVDFDLYYER